MPSSSLHSVPSLSDPSIPSSARSSPSTSIHQRRLARVPDANGDYHHRTRPCPAPFLPLLFSLPSFSLSLTRSSPLALFFFTGNQPAMAADCPRRHPSDPRRISLAAAPPRAIVLRLCSLPALFVDAGRRAPSEDQQEAPAALDLIVAARISKPALRQVILSPGMDSPTPDLTPPVVPVAGAFNNAPSPAMDARPRCAPASSLPPAGGATTCPSPAASSAPCPLPRCPCSPPLTSLSRSCAAQGATAVARLPLPSPGTELLRPSAAPSPR